MAKKVQPTEPITNANKWTAQYKDPRWQKKRLSILNRDQFACQECGATDKELHVHHRFYLKGRKVWEYDSDVLVSLCSVCHSKQHENAKFKETDELLILINNLSGIDRIQVNNFLQFMLGTEFKAMQFFEWMLNNDALFKTTIFTIYQDMQISALKKDIVALKNKNQEEPF